MYNALENTNDFVTSYVIINYVGGNYPLWINSFNFNRFSFRAMCSGGDMAGVLGYKIDLFSPQHFRI